MFSDKLNQLLKYNLDGNRVKTRRQGNITLSYLEGYDLINTANYAFGFGNWSYRVTKLEQVSEEINEKKNRVIGYRAIVAITVNDLAHKHSITREDVGFGTGIAKQYADAHESGAKEAVTDGLKRALRTFGSQFGNALYDKQQRNVDHKSQRPQQIPQQQQQPPQQNSEQYNQQPVNNYESLKQLGLEVQEQNGILVVLGQTFGKQQTLKELNFLWDASRKIWWKALGQEAA